MRVKSLSNPSIVFLACEQIYLFELLPIEQELHIYLLKEKAQIYLFKLSEKEERMRCR
jgi:hypothetical protein